MNDPMNDRLREALNDLDDGYGVHDEVTPTLEVVIEAARKVLAGPSPEAVQAAAKALYDLDDVSVETWEDAAYVAEVRDWYRGLAQAALAAAWATDFGDPT